MTMTNETCTGPARAFLLHKTTPSNPVIRRTPAVSLLYLQ